jgi:uncharacterized protein YndB with AHSA1/START domain
MNDVVLMVRRTIAAPVSRVFEAWTQPEHLRRWWGPREVTCTEAEVDLRVGGQYRIANQFPDGSVLWISGEFERVTPPRELVYSWCVEPGDAQRSRVTVRFEARNDMTEVIVLHERIADEATRDRHVYGWEGCLDGLVDLFSTTSCNAS